MSFSNLLARMNCYKMENEKLKNIIQELQAQVDDLQQKNQDLTNQNLETLQMVIKRDLQILDMKNKLDQLHLLILDDTGSFIQ